MYKKIILLGLLALTSVWSSGSVRAETLQESVMQALSTHPSVQAAERAKDIARQDKAIAKSAYFPVVSANTSVGGIYANNSTSRGLTVSRGSGRSALWEADARITQPLFDAQATKNRVEAANARMISADYSVADIRENLALQAVQSHIAVMQAQATLDRTQSYLDSIEDYLSRIQMMVSEGVADQAEAAQARNISLMLKSSLADYQGQLDAALANYAQITGNAPRKAMIKPSNVTTINKNIDAAIAYAQANHPMLMANEMEMRALSHEATAESSALYPTIDAELSGLKREQKDIIGGELEDARAVVKLGWNFETGGALKARSNRIKAQSAEITAQNDERRRSIQGDIKRAYTELNTAQKQVMLVKERESVTSELYDAYKTQFEGALVRLLQLMQAENQLFNAQLESITAQYRHLLAQYNILASMGQLQDTILAGQAVSQAQPMVQDIAPQPKPKRTLVQKTKAIAARPIAMISPKTAVKPPVKVEPVQELRAPVQYTAPVLPPVTQPVKASSSTVPWTTTNERIHIDIQK